MPATEKLTVITVRRNHCAMEVEFRGNRPATVAEIKRAVKAQFPTIRAVGISQDYLDSTFASWHRYGSCTYIAGTRFVKQRAARAVVQP